MRKCFTPLIPLTDCDGRLSLDLGNCNCSSEVTHLVITQGGCTEYEEKIHFKTCEPRGWGCGSAIYPPTLVVEDVPIPKASIIYPFHDTDCNGNAVFVLDGKLKKLGYGRYHAEVIHDGNCISQFDIDYYRNTGHINAVSTARTSKMGERC